MDSLVRGVNQLRMNLHAVDYSKEIALKVSKQQPQGPLRYSHSYSPVFNMNYRQDFSWRKVTLKSA